MKKHLWLVAVSAILLMGVAYALKTRKTVDIKTITATNAAGSDDKSLGYDTTFIESNAGQWNGLLLNIRFELLDSSGVRGAGAGDSAYIVTRGVMGEKHYTIDSLLTTLASLTDYSRSIQIKDSAGVTGKIKGDKVAVIIRTVDSADTGPTLGSDSVIQYRATITSYFVE